MCWTCVSTKRLPILCKYFLWALYQVDEWDKSIWFRTIFTPPNHVSCRNTLRTSKRMLTIFLCTVNTYCVHVQTGYTCRLEICGDLNYRKFTAKGWADLQRVYWTIEWDVDPSRAETSQKPKGWIYFSKLGDSHCAPSWLLGPSEGVSLCSEKMLVFTAFRITNDTDGLNVVLNSFGFFRLVVDFL